MVGEDRRCRLVVIAEAPGEGSDRCPIGRPAPGLQSPPADVSQTVSRSRPGPVGVSTGSANTGTRHAQDAEGPAGPRHEHEKAPPADMRVSQTGRGPGDHCSTLLIGRPGAGLEPEIPHGREDGSQTRPGVRRCPRPQPDRSSTPDRRRDATRANRNPLSMPCCREPGAGAEVARRPSARPHADDRAVGATRRPLGRDRDQQTDSRTTARHPADQRMAAAARTRVSPRPRPTSRRQHRPRSTDGSAELAAGSGVPPQPNTPAVPGTAAAARRDALNRPSIDPRRRADRGVIPADHQLPSAQPLIASSAFTVAGNTPASRCRVVRLRPGRRGQPRRTCTA